MLKKLNYYHVLYAVVFYAIGSLIYYTGFSHGHDEARDTQGYNFQNTRFMK